MKRIMNREKDRKCMERRFEIWGGELNGKPVNSVM